MADQFKQITDLLREIGAERLKAQGDIWELKYNLRQLVECISRVPFPDRPDIAEASVLKAEQLIERITKEYDL